MRLASIHTYPIKGCHRLDHDGAEVEPWGLAGDRRWMLVNEDGRALTQRETPLLARIQPRPNPDGGLTVRLSGRPDLVVAQPTGAELADVTVWRSMLPAELADTAADEWLSNVLDRKVRLVWLGDPSRRATNPAYSAPGDRVSFADGYPLLLTNAASLDALNGWLQATGDLDGPVPMSRFRPNVVVAGAEPWAEDEWLGRRIRIGGVDFRAVKPCDRCVVTT
ncbi:MAG TPA: MOSC N-terminal beta barrel domain-containing protein, partial [Micromonospora sp.]|nr:MOSC N-terminal beta barrel domain-containing protein [Micromonospora sp.]